MTADRTGPRRGSRGAIHVAASLLIAVAPFLLAAAGALSPIDNVLRGLRFGATTVPASGNIVFVEIDSRSLAEVGVWPWPRGLHAQMLETLLDLGAANVALDIDFSSRSSEAEDARLAAALDNAGGYAMLAAFKQTAADGSVFYNMPLPVFAGSADVVAVNVAADPDGVVRTYPFAVTLDGAPYSSMASAISGVSGPVDEAIVIDFSLDPGSVPRISASDVLAGAITADAVRDRTVVIGATAIELHDLFLVPNHGLVPGAIVQVLAAETMSQQRIPAPVGPLPLLLLVVGAAILASWRGRRTDLPIQIGALVLTIAVIEGIAVLLQVHQRLLLDTAAADIALVMLGVRAAIDEITHRRRLHAEAGAERDATQRTLNRVIADNFDGILVINHAGRILAASRLAETLLGGALVGRTIPGSLPPQLEAEIAADWDRKAQSVTARDMQIVSAQGDRRTIEYAITPSDIDSRGRSVSGRAVCVTFRDITERRASEERLQYLARHDPLTGALTRLELTQRVQAYLDAHASEQPRAIMLVVELNRFKSVNDALGHAYGDLLLEQVVVRLRSVASDLVARIGGDSFAVAMLGTAQSVEVQSVCDTVLAAITAPYEFSRHRAVVGTRIGVAESTGRECRAAALLSRADMALSTTKGKSANAVTMFSDEMDQRVRDKQEIEVELRSAIAAGQLSIHYQPQVLIETQELVGAEALVRWEHERLGTLSPARFIPLAEETGLIVELGRFVLHAACREATRWPAAIRLAVNVSPVQFELSDVFADVSAALQASGLAPDRLDIEITEGVFVDESDAVLATLERLRALGVGIALDDFGTGYSSLSYLGRLPLDKIKIDQSFVRKLPGDPEAGAIVWSVMKLAETLGKGVVAEGVETAEQAWMLKLMGCNIAQGYHYSRPVPSAEMSVLVNAPRAHVDSRMRA